MKWLWNVVPSFAARTGPQLVSRELRNPVETKASRRDTIGGGGSNGAPRRAVPRGVGREETAAFIYQGKEDGGEGGGRTERQSRGVLHVSLQRGVDPK